MRENTKMPESNESNESKRDSYQCKIASPEEAISELIEFLRTVVAKRHSVNQYSLFAAEVGTQTHRALNLLEQFIEVYDRDVKSFNDNVASFLNSLHENNVFDSLDADPVFTQSLSEFFSYYPDYLPDSLKYRLPLDFNWVVHKTEQYASPKIDEEKIEEKRPAETDQKEITTKIDELLVKLKSLESYEAEVCEILDEILRSDIKTLPEDKFFSLMVFLFKKYLNSDDWTGNNALVILSNIKYLSFKDYEKIMVLLLNDPNKEETDAALQRIVSRFKFFLKYSIDPAITAKISKMIDFINTKSIKDADSESKAQDDKKFSDVMEDYVRSQITMLQSTQKDIVSKAKDTVSQAMSDLYRIGCLDLLSQDVNTLCIRALIPYFEQTHDEDFLVVQRLIGRASREIYNEVSQLILKHMEHQNKISDVTLSILITTLPDTDPDTKKKIAQCLFNTISTKDFRKLSRNDFWELSEIFRAFPLIVVDLESHQIDLFIKFIYPIRYEFLLIVLEGYDRINFFERVIKIFFAILENDPKKHKIDLQKIIYITLHCIARLQLNKLIRPHKLWEQAGKIFASFSPLDRIVVIRETARIAEAINNYNDKILRVECARTIDQEKIIAWLHVLLAPIMATSPIPAAMEEISNYQSRLSVCMGLFNQAQDPNQKPALRGFATDFLFEPRLIGLIFSFTNIATQQQKQDAEQQDHALVKSLSSSL